MTTPAPACPRCQRLAAYGEPHCKDGKGKCRWIICPCRATYDPGRGTSYHPADWTEKTHD